MPRQTVVAVSPELTNQKDLTYLELPPDEQKVSKRPDTNIISDKDRIATSHAPQMDRQELKKILDASRPGRPGASGPQAPATTARASGSAQQPRTLRPSRRRHHRPLRIRTRLQNCRLRLP